MENSQDFRFICGARTRYPQLSHASNIITKITGNLTAKDKSALDLLIPQYADYLREMLGISGFDKASIQEKVDYLNEYYNFMHYNQLDRAFSSQGKFRPTILEEFLYLLFKDYVDSVKRRYDKKGVLGSGAVKAYSNLYFRQRISATSSNPPKLG